MTANLITIFAVTCALLPLITASNVTGDSCSEPPPLSGAYRIGWNSTVAKYVCLDRHTPTDEFSIACEGLQWDHTDRCKVNCDPTIQVDGADVFVNETEEGAVADYRCKENHTDTLFAVTNRTCSPKNGRWTGIGAVCTGPEDLALNQPSSYPNVTDADVETCTESTSVVVTISTNESYNIHTVVLYYKYPVDEVNVTLHLGYPDAEAGACGLLESPVAEKHVKIDCSAKLFRTTYIHILTHADGEPIGLCDVQAYGRVAHVDCMEPPVVVGAMATYNDSSWMANAMYSCIPPYVYIGGDNTIVCRLSGWTQPRIKCAEMENFARLGKTEFEEIIDNDHTTCRMIRNNEIIYLDRRKEVHVVVLVSEGNAKDIQVLLHDEGTLEKSCKRQNDGATIGIYNLRAFDCPGFPFAIFFRITALQLVLCEVSVYGRDATQGALECQQTELGLDYKGSLNFTVDGSPCLSWMDIGYNITNFPDYNIAKLGNKCRNPLNGRIGPYCHVTRDSYDFCPVPKCDDICRQGNGRTYDGGIHQTQNGTSCIPWNSNPEQFALNGVMPDRSESFCRNPIGSMSQPWCFIGPSSEYELCDVPLCPVSISVVPVYGTVSDPELQMGCFCWDGDEISFPVLRQPLANVTSLCSYEGSTVLLCYTGEGEQKVWVNYILRRSETTTQLLTKDGTTLGSDSSTLKANGTTYTTETPAPIQDNNNHTMDQTVPRNTSETTASTSETTSYELKSTSESSTRHQQTTSRSTPMTTLETTSASTTHVSRTSTTSSNQQNCQCRCKRDLSTGAIAAVMDERKANLTVDPKTTTAFLRKKTSAKDKRTTATVSGTTCVAVVSVMFSVIFIPDIINLATFIFKFKK